MDAGADKFIYQSGDGKDIIFGFDNKDILTLDNLDLGLSEWEKCRTKSKPTKKISDRINVEK